MRGEVGGCEARSIKSWSDGCISSNHICTTRTFDETGMLYRKGKKRSLEMHNSYSIQHRLAAPVAGGCSVACRPQTNNTDRSFEAKKQHARWSLH